MTITSEQLLEHVHKTLAVYVSGVDDVRYMSEHQSKRIREIIFETDLFLDRSGIDPEIQYRHHLEWLQMLDESDEFAYIFHDLEFQKHVRRQYRRLNKMLYGQDTPPETISESECISLIQNAWRNASTPQDRIEVFVAMYQQVLFNRNTIVHHAIRASVFMKSAKRFGKIVERTMGSTDPEVFLQAVTDELTDYHLGHVQSVLVDCQGNLQVPRIVISKALERKLGKNLAIAICHPDLQDLSVGSVVQRVLHQLPSPNGQQSRKSTRSNIEASIRNGTFHKVDFSEVVGVDRIIESISEPLQRVADEIAQEVEQAEKPYAGYWPVGAKVHFREAVPAEKLQPLFDTFGYGQSPFKMLHADESMLIPPRKSAPEVVAMLEELKRIGILNERSDIQACIPGRLNNQYAGILGSSMLLSSFLCVTYPRSSFETSHNEQTASMIMAYDAGVLDKSVTELPEDVTGRIDMLGRKDVRDMYLYQALGSFISQAVYGGSFQQIGREYIEEYVRLLEKAGMLDVLEAQWINDPKNAVEPDIEGHYQAVKRCTDTWLADNEQYQETGSQNGLTFSVLRLLTEKLQEARVAQVRLGLIESHTPQISPFFPNNQHV